MTPAQIAANRHLLGLSQFELAEALGVNRHAVKDWESGRFAARSGVIAELAELRRAHDAELAEAVEAVDRRGGFAVPSGPMPRGWYLALAARLIDRVPDARIMYVEATSAS